MKQNLIIKDLGDICHFQNGFAFKSKTFKEFGEPVVRITNIQNDRVESKGFVFVDRKDYSQDLSKYEVKKGDLLIAMSGATTGKIGLYRSEKILLLNQRVGLFKPSKSLDKQYLYYFLSTKVEESLAISAGAAQPNLSTEQIKAFQIPLAPLPEQQRIVSILDEAFAAIDQAKANAEQNLKNAKELFESYLQGVFEKKGDGWEEKTLGEVCDFSNGKAHEKIIDGDGKYILINSKFVSSEGQKFKRTTSMLSPLYKGDIVFVMSDVPNGKTLAKCFLVDKDDTYSLNQRICVIRSNNYDKRFLYYHLNRHRYLLSFNNGENQTNLRKNDILNTPLFLMPNEEQQTIVRQLDAIKIETQKMEAIYLKKIADLEELKKSVLQKAFAGELKVSELGWVGLKDDKIKMNT